MGAGSVEVNTKDSCCWEDPPKIAVGLYQERRAEIWIENHRNNERAETMKNDSIDQGTPKVRSEYDSNTSKSCVMLKA